MKITLYLLERNNITPYNFEMGSDYTDLIVYCDDPKDYYQQTEEEFIGICKRFLYEQECMEINMYQEQTLIITESELEGLSKKIYNIYSDKVDTK
jgi:hypothetical protein